MADISERSQYATPDNLRARIGLHGYARNPNWTGWLFERERPREPGPVRILDVGCGPGGLWTSNRDRINTAWSLTLADSSAGMIDAARSELGDRAHYLIAEIGSRRLPLPDESFDVVVANHMLYHVENRPAAFAEVARVLAPGGVFHCSTNGRGHMNELIALGDELSSVTRFNEIFGFETGPAQLEPFFDDVSIERFDNVIEVPEVEPVLGYIRSTIRHQAGTDMSGIAATVQAAIDRDGVFSIDTRAGVISCRRR